MNEQQLPPLPENPKHVFLGHHIYTAEQMQAYARAALAANTAAEELERARNAGFVEASRIHGREIEGLRAALAANVPADLIQSLRNLIDCFPMLVAFVKEDNRTMLRDCLARCREALSAYDISAELAKAAPAPEATPAQAQQPLTAHQIKMLPLTIEMGWDEIVRVIERAHGIGASGDGKPEAQQPEAKPLTAMQARSVVDGMGWALDEVEIEDMEMLVKAAERACAEAWGVRLAGIGASGEGVNG